MKNFDQNCKVILAEYMCFYLLIKRCSKVKSSHLWAKGLEREAFKNSRLMIVSLMTKKLTIKSNTWKGIKTQFWLGGGGRGGNWTNQPSKVQMLRGGCWSTHQSKHFVSSNHANVSFKPLLFLFRICPSSLIYRSTRLAKCWEVIKFHFKDKVRSLLRVHPTLTDRITC